MELLASFVAFVSSTLHMFKDEMHAMSRDGRSWAG